MHGSVFKEQEKNAALRETHIPAAMWVKNVFTRCSLSMGTAYATGRKDSEVYNIFALKQS